VGADAGYGKSCEAFYNLTEMGETFFIDIPSAFSVYLSDPEPQRKRPAGPCGAEGSSVVVRSEGTA